jgi:hypothetical protein
VPPEIVQIPYQDTSLPGYFFRAAADADPRPTAILTNGYDGTAEELYFTNGAAALERGYKLRPRAVSPACLRLARACARPHGGRLGRLVDCPVHGHLRGCGRLPRIRLTRESLLVNY